VKRIAIPVAAVVVLAVALAWWAVWRTTSGQEILEAPPRKESRPAVALPPLAPQAMPVGPPPVATPRATMAAASIAMRDEIRDATDLRAYYERTRDLPDPTGERSYRMAEAIFECSAFIDIPYDALSKRLAIRGAALRNERRNQVLATMAARCKGFSGMGARFGEIQAELHKRAEAAGYPAEVARTLRMEPAVLDIERADAVATKLLESNLDPEVLLEVSQYLNVRNRGVQRQGDAQARAIAWGMLECAYGADCGPQSRSMTMTCILLGACELTRIEDAIMAQGTAQGTLNEAIRLRDLYAEHLANRDWAGLGFIPRNKPPAGGPT
jgi:hypothetical protein